MRRAMVVALAACGASGPDEPTTATFTELRARVPCAAYEHGCEAPCVEIDWTRAPACECTPDHCEPLAWRGHRGFCEDEGVHFGPVFQYCRGHGPGLICTATSTEIRDNHGHEWTYDIAKGVIEQERYTAGPADHRHFIGGGGSDYYLLRGSTMFWSTYAQIEPHAHDIVISCELSE